MKYKNMFINDKLYKEIIKNTIIQTLDIVFLNENNQILLGLRKNPPLKGIYYLPGGRRNKNETILESAKRKAKEEIGIDIDVKKLIFLGVYDDIYDDSIYEDIGTHCSPIIYIYRLNSVEEKNIKKDTQHSELKFFELDDNSLNEILKIRIIDVKNILNNK